MTHAVLVHNPASRHALRTDALVEALRVGEAAEWRISSVETKRAGDAKAVAEDAAASGFDAVIVNGGDGTINEAVNGLAGSETALAVIPGGTANVWAKEISMPRDPVAAMREVVCGERRRIDLGRAGGRHFLLMAGIGLDAEVVRRVGPRLKERLGAPAHLISAVPAAIRRRPVRVQMIIDGVAGETMVYWMVVGNTRLYGGVREITHRAVVDDGLLDVAWMRFGGLHRLVTDGVRLVRGTHHRSRNVRYLQARSIEIETAGMPVQVDGELHGETPMRFEVAPGALTVIVPAALRTPLFGVRAETSEAGGDQSVRPRAHT